MKHLKRITVRSQFAMVGCERVVMRAVPCAAHASYAPDCSDCLTGEQAAKLGLDVVAARHDVRVYHNPFRQLLWRLRHPHSGSVRVHTPPITKR